MKTIEQNKTEVLQELGFALRVDAGPVGVVDKDKESAWVGAVDKEKAWPHIAYEVELLFNGRPILVEPTVKSYRLGVGHVDPAKTRIGLLPASSGFTEDQARLIEAWAGNKSAQFKDRQLWASAAAALAKKQNVKPQLADVLHSLLSDGEAYFNAQSFEQWASEFGYDSDSRKAEAIYKACDTIGRKLAAVVPAEVLNKAREILQDY